MNKQISKLIIVSLFSISIPIYSYAESSSIDPYRLKGEKHLRNIKMITNGGENAEAYFSFNEKKLIYQSTSGDLTCDQIFIMNIDGSDKKMVSTGKGRTTCSYFMPDDQKILYASTHLADVSCPPPPDVSKGYVWKLYDSFDIFLADSDGSNMQRLTETPGYDAEATVSPAGDKIVFTSSRDGDLDLYTMNIDGSDVRRITSDLGYDGGAFFSWDGKRIVYRAFHHTDSTAAAEYKALLAEQLVKPTRMEIFVCDADGKNRKQLTRTEGANFAPFFHPDNKRIIFSSNSDAPGSRLFHLSIMNDDGTKKKQVTYGGSFNAFPMFSRDGKQIVFVSDRNAKGRYEFNVFLADWIE